jgi:hypothetical protein
VLVPHCTLAHEIIRRYCSTLVTGPAYRTDEPVAFSSVASGTEVTDGPWELVPVVVAVGEIHDKRLPTGHRVIVGLAHKSGPVVKMPESGRSPVIDDGYRLGMSATGAFERPVRASTRPIGHSKGLYEDHELCENRP